LRCDADCTAPMRCGMRKTGWLSLERTELSKGRVGKATMEGVGGAAKKRLRVTGGQPMRTGYAGDNWTRVRDRGPRRCAAGDDGGEQRDAITLVAKQTDLCERKGKQRGMGS
jgi:hypothetical protein